MNSLKRLLVLTITIVVFAIIVPTLLIAQEGIPCSSEPTDMSITYGNLVTCEINPAGDTDVFRFTGISGEGVVIRAVPTAAAGPTVGAPGVNLYRPDGSLLASGSGNGWNNWIARVYVKLDQTGGYSIILSDVMPETTMQYTLSLERVGAPPSPNAKPIFAACLINDEINPGGDVDSYYFQGNQGTTANLLFTIPGGYPSINVYRPDGTVLYEDTYPGGGSVDISLNQTGTHTILLADWRSYDLTPRPYTLSLQCVGSCPPAPGPRLDITMNKSSFVNGDIVVANEFRLSNQGSAPEITELKVWLVAPGIPSIGILNLGADGSFVVPTSFNQNFGPLTLFTVIQALPRGIYEFNSRINDPVTGKTLSEDLNPFVIQ